ncbi:MAG TPA: hypothetical protein VF266_04240 [Thermoanaerobaculia bacterium]
MADEQKEHIQRAIVRARDGVGDRIDELDRRLRDDFNPKTLARTYAPHLIAGGAVLGIVVGFGFPKVFRKLITWGVPIGIIAMTVKNAREANQLST